MGHWLIQRFEQQKELTAIVDQFGAYSYEQLLEKLNTVREVMNSDTDIVTTALRYVISHPAAPVAIPGATSVAQAENNAKIGAQLLTDKMLQALREL